MSFSIDNNNQYLELIKSFPPRHLTSEDDLINTQNIINSLIDQGELTPDEQDDLNVLGSLVQDYEELNHPIPKPDPIELIKALLNKSNLQAQDSLAIFFF